MYDDIHRFFIQFMLKNKCVSVDSALDFTKKIKDDVNTESKLKVLVLEINCEVSKQELKIIYTKCEVTGTLKLLLLNTANDNVTKHQNSFTAAELEYFQTLFNELVMIPDHKLPVMACFNLNNSSTNTISKDSMEKLLEKWREEGYLVLNDSYTYLGPRCIQEFSTYLTQHCKDYCSSCYLCSELVFVGHSCSVCHKIMHDHCINKYLEKQKRCPSCKKDWIESDSQNEQDVDNESEQGENTVEESVVESETEEIPRPGPSTRKRRRLQG